MHQFASELSKIVEFCKSCLCYLHTLSLFYDSIRTGIIVSVLIPISHSTADNRKGKIQINTEGIALPVNAVPVHICFVSLLLQCGSEDERDKWVRRITKVRNVSWLNNVQAHLGSSMCLFSVFF